MINCLTEEGLFAMMTKEALCAKHAALLEKYLSMLYKKWA